METFLLWIICVKGLVWMSPEYEVACKMVQLRFTQVQTEEVLDKPPGPELGRKRPGKT